MIVAGNQHSVAGKGARPYALATFSQEQWFNLWWSRWRSNLKDLRHENLDQSINFMVQVQVQGLTRINILAESANKQSRRCTWADTKKCVTPVPTVFPTERCQSSVVSAPFMKWRAKTPGSHLGWCWKSRQSSSKIRPNYLKAIVFFFFCKATSMVTSLFHVLLLIVPSGLETKGVSESSLTKRQMGLPNYLSNSCCEHRRERELKKISKWLV